QTCGGAHDVCFGMLVCLILYAFTFFCETLLVRYKSRHSLASPRPVSKSLKANRSWSNSSLKTGSEEGAARADSHNRRTATFACRSRILAAHGSTALNGE